MTAINWFIDPNLVVSPKLGIAVYPVDNRHIAIHQQADVHEDPDHIIYIHQNDIDAVIAALQNIKDGQ